MKVVGRTLNVSGEGDGCRRATAGHQRLEEVRVAGSILQHCIWPFRTDRQTIVWLWAGPEELEQRGQSRHEAPSSPPAALSNTEETSLCFFSRCGDGFFPAVANLRTRKPGNRSTGWISASSTTQEKSLTAPSVSGDKAPAGKVPEPLSQGSSCENESQSTCPLKVP